MISIIDLRLTIVFALCVLLVVCRFLLQFHLLQMDGADQLSLHTVIHLESRQGFITLN